MKSTTDIWLAGYLLRKGNQVKRIDRSGKRAKWCFDLTDEEWEAAKLDMSQGVDREIKYTHETLKDLFFQ